MTDLTNDKTKLDSENQLKRLNIFLYSLCTFLLIYCVTMFYTLQIKTDNIKNVQTTLQTIVMYPKNHQIGGLDTITNTTLVTTNITTPATVVPYNEKTFVNQKEYLRGDVVLLKYFNIYAVVQDKASVDEYYNIMYRDNNHRLEVFSVPVSFLLKPSANVMTPFIFTP